jgi:hypothetical protein
MAISNSRQGRPDAGSVLAGLRRLRMITIDFSIGRSALTAGHKNRLVNKFYAGHSFTALSDA